MTEFRDGGLGTRGQGLGVRVFDGESQSQSTEFSGQPVEPNTSSAACTAFVRSRWEQTSVAGDSPLDLST